MSLTAGTDDGTTQDPGGFTPVTDEEIAKAMEQEGGEGEPAEKPASQTPESAPAAEPTIEVDGEKLTAAQIRELKKGGLMLSDYSREKNRLAEERRAFEREREEFQRARQTPRETQEAEDEDPDARMARRLEALERRDKERDLDILAERAETTYQKTLDALCQKHGVTNPKMREVYDRIIAGHNPEVGDLKRLSEEVTRIFEEAHEVLGGMSKAAVDSKLEELKKSARPPSPKGGGAAPLTPGAKPKRSFDDPVTAEEIAEATGG